MNPDEQQQPHPLEPGIEALVATGADTNKLLETIVHQNEKNNPEPALEALVVGIKQVADKLDTQSAGIDENDHGVVVYRLKGERGDTGEQGPQGNSIVGPRGPQGDKGDSVIGPPGPQGDKGDSVVGPPGPQGESGSPDTGKQIAEKLTALPKDDRLSYDALKDTPNVIEMVRKSGFGQALSVQRSNALVVSDVKVLDFLGAAVSVADLGGGVISVTINGPGATYTETPSGVLDGVNKTYTTLHAITTIFAFAINGQFIHPSDYSVVGTTITFGTALPVELAGTAFTIIYA